MLTLMMTTLLWADRRHNEISQLNTYAKPSPNAKLDRSIDARLPVPNNTPEEPRGLEETSTLPARIHEQVVNTVLRKENLDKLEEWYGEGAIKIDFASGQDLAPRQYVYEPRGVGVG